MVENLISKKRITDKITETINLGRVTCMVNITGSTAIVQQQHTEHRCPNSATVI